MAQPADDRVLLVTRLTAAAVVVVLFFGFVTLLAFPDRTADLFAWKIKAQMTSMLLGSAYASGAYYFTRIVVARRWHSVAVGLLPIAGFAWLMEIATLIHWDVFIRNHWPFIFWIVVYSITPFLVPLVWILNRPRDPGTLDEVDAELPPRVRLVLGAWGGAMVGMAAFVYLAPQTAIAIWPWPLTPLTSRVLGAWFVWGTFGLLLSRDPRWSSARVVTEAMIVGAVLTLAGVGRTWEEFDTSRPFTYVFLASAGFGLLFFGWLYTTMERTSRAGHHTPSPAAAGSS
jgi:hypothetical protein